MGKVQKQKAEAKVDKQTTEFADEIGGCYGRREFEALILENETLFRSWESTIGPLLKNGPRGTITNEMLASGLGLSVNCVSKFRHNIPSKRRSVIMMAAMIRLDVEQTNDLLCNWAKFHKLYAKNPEDAIWIYILNNGGTDRPNELFLAYYDIYSTLRKQELKKRGAAVRIPMETVMVEESISRVRRDDGVLPEEDLEFIRMMQQYVGIYEDGYQKLADYIESAFIRVCESHLGLLTVDELDTLKENKKITPNILFQNNTSYKNRFYNRIRNIRRNHEVPKRAFLISIGIHLAMTRRQINYMLKLAGMQPLCAKDRLESALIFYLEELYLCYPSFFRQGDDCALQDCTLEDLQAMGEDGPMLRFDKNTEAPSERMMEYIKRCLEESRIFSEKDRKNSHSDLNEFLGLL